MEPQREKRSHQKRQGRREKKEKEVSISRQKNSRLEDQGFFPCNQVRRKASGTATAAVYYLLRVEILHQKKRAEASISLKFESKYSARDPIFSKCIHILLGCTNKLASARSHVLRVGTKTEMKKESSCS